MLPEDAMSGIVEHLEPRSGNRGGQFLHVLGGRNRVEPPAEDEGRRADRSEL
jgi:hypothetical protein